MGGADCGAVVVAAGRGERFGGKKPFEQLAGRSVIERAFRAVAAVKRVGWVAVAVGRDDVARTEELLSHCGKLRKVIEGGRLRQESVRNGFGALPDEARLILVHDGSRPLATAELARTVLEAAERWGASVPALPVVETLKRASAERPLVAETVPREGLYSVQTPQGFRREVLEEALAFARARGLQVTDEAALVEACGGKVALVEGERANIKLTYREDLALAEVLIREAEPCARG